jgi:hypothetical protein
MKYYTPIGVRRGPKFTSESSSCPEKQVVEIGYHPSEFEVFLTL